MRESQGYGDELDLQAIERHLEREWPTHSHLVQAYFYARQLIAEIRRMEKVMDKKRSDVVGEEIAQKPRPREPWMSNFDALQQEDEKYRRVREQESSVTRFLESYSRGGFTEQIADRVLAEAAYRQVLMGKPDPVRQRVLGLRLKKDATFNQLLERLAAVGFLPILEGEKNTLLVCPGNGAIQIYGIIGTEKLSIEVAALRSGAEVVKKVLEETCEEVGIASEEQDPRASLYALVHTNRDFNIVPVGRVGVPFPATNYPEQIATQFKLVANQLEAEQPHGRLLLLDGPTGVGKTYLIRSLMQDCENAVFAVVMPDVLPHLGGPGILPVLMDQVAGSDRKLVLVIEDGDLAVRRRTKTKSASAVSALLNLSEGLLGSALDLRIIVTTNTEIDEIDPAVSRSGRMMAHVRLRDLNIEEAMRALHAVCPGATRNPQWNDKICLSDVYAWAFQLGYEVPKSQRPTPLGEVMPSGRRRRRQIPKKWI